MANQKLYAHNVYDHLTFFHNKYIDGGKYTDITRDFRRYSVAREFEKRLKLESKDTPFFTYAVMTGGYDNWQLDSFYNPDSLTREPLGTTGTVKWSVGKTGWHVDEREPGYPKHRPEAGKVVDTFSMHRHNMWNKFWMNQEVYRWTLAPAPNDGTAGFIRPHGVPNYVVASATAAVGQNGGHPSGYSSVDGVSRTTYPAVKNYTATYSTVSDDDLGLKMSTMIDQMLWIPPQPNPDVIEPQMNFRIYSGYIPYQRYQVLLRTSNDNIGMDAGKFYGAVGKEGSLLFRNVPWEYVPALSDQYLADRATANPAYDPEKVYLLDESTWDVYGAKGYWMKELPPQRQDNPHNVIVNHMDHIMQRVCRMPQANGVIAKAA